ncbi:hypothetical protein B0I35DRAFT_447536 [Stachybotrys elegans]|uniref:NACHT domain-containing protein n=1 Tax=Stachybotrys elegans TaxID=80388 RepID=A0A8K0SCK9_9HYPO|nr:hypothetical protein B0I35DRAFT_447536 [Stachybotrys elegans]
MSAQQNNTTTVQAEKIISDAASRFKNVVTPDDIATFNATTADSVIIALRVIQDDLRKKRENRNLRKLVPFLEGLKKYGAAVDVLSNGLSPFLPFAWAPMKLFLQITADHLDAFDKLVEAYSKIADTLPHVNILAESFSDKPSMLTKIALYFAELLEFHRRAYKFVRRQSWKSFFMTTWGQFDLRFESILKSLTYYSDAIMQEAATIDLYEARRWRERLMDEVKKQEADRAEVQRLALLAWLGVEPIPQEEEQEKLLRDYMPGTSDWLQGTLKPWLETTSSQQSIVWLHGKPGAGKSVLCASLIDSLKDPSMRVLYYFCQHHHPSVTSSQILRALVRQAVAFDAGLIPAAYINFAARSTSPTRSVLREMLFGSANNPGMLAELSICRVIVDGIDECGDDEQKLIVGDLMQAALKSASSNCKLLMSSRDIRNISKALGKRRQDIFEISLSREQRFLNDSIRSYVGKRLADIRDESTDLWATEGMVNDVQQAMIERADGMFLWVRLVLDILSDIDSLGELHSAIMAMPKELPQLYRRILDRMFHGLTDHQINNLRRILAWLAFAKRPLKRHELLHVALITYNDLLPTKRDVLHATAINKCKPLAEELPGGTVALVHSTAEEYLRESCQSLSFDILNYKELIAYACVSTLTEGLALLEPDIPLYTHLNHIAQGLYTILPYAIDFWTQHIQEVSIPERQDMPPRLAVELSRLDSRHKQLRQRLSDSSLEQQTDPSSTSDSIYSLFSWFQKNHKDLSATNGEEWQQLVQSKDPTLLTALSAKLDGLIQSLASGQNHTGHIPEVDLRKFLTAHGSCLFRCRFLPCTNSSLGFDTDGARLAHERLHTQRLLCPQPGCRMGRIGFQKHQDLKRHMRAHHQEGGLLVPPKVRQSSANRLSPDTNHGEIVFDERVERCPNGMSGGVQVLKGSDVRYEFRNGNIIQHATTDWIYFCDLEKPDRLRIDHLHSLDTKGLCNDIRFSHGGDLVAFSSHLSIQLHRVKTGQFIAAFKCSDGLARSACFSADDKVFVAATDTGKVMAWDISTKLLLRSTEIGNAYVNDLMMSLDAGLLACATRDNTVRLWDIMGDQRPEDGQRLSLATDPWCIAFSPDEKSLIVGCEKGELHIWDLVSGSKQFDRRNGHRDTVNSISFSPDGLLFVTASHDSTAKLWSLADRNCIRSFNPGLTDWICSAKFLPAIGNNKARVILSSGDYKIQVWDLETGDVKLILMYNNVYPIDLLDATFFESGCLIASASETDSAYIWSISVSF